jgi:hypothetical protein
MPQQEKTVLQLIVPEGGSTVVKDKVTELVRMDCSGPKACRLT